MALASQSRSFASGTTSATISAFTPGALSRIFAWAVAGRNNSVLPTWSSIAGGSLTWNSISDQTRNTGSFRYRCTLWYADVGASPVSTSIAATASASTQRVAIGAVEVTGANLTTPTVFEDASANPSPTFTQPAAGNHMLSFAGSLSDVARAFSGDGNATELWTEELGGSNPFGNIAAQVRTSGSYTTLGWTSTASNGFGADVLLEALPVVPGLVLPRTRMGTRWMTSKRF